MTSNSNPMNPLPEEPTQATAYDLPFLLTLAMVFCVVLGMFMGLFGLTYINDLQTLRGVPDLIWNFACGQPYDSPMILPLLLTLSLLSFMVTGVLFGVRWWLLRGKHG